MRARDIDVGDVDRGRHLDGLRLEELAASKSEEQQDGDRKIDAEARQERRDLVQGKPALATIRFVIPP